MRSILSLLVAFSLLLIGAARVRSGEDRDARAVIDKAIAALGGEANLAKFQTTTYKETGTYYGMGEGLPYTGNYAVQLPGRFRMEVEGVFVVVLDGDKGWIKSAQGVNDMTKEQLASQVNNHRAGWISTLVPLKDKAFALKALADAKVGDTPARVVEVTRQDYPTVKLYFDKASGLPVKTEYRSKSPELNFQEVTMEAYPSNYKDADGAKVAHKAVLKRDGKDFVVAELSEVRAVGKLDAKVFAKPAE